MKGFVLISLYLILLTLFLEAGLRLFHFSPSSSFIDEERIQQAELFIVVLGDHYSVDPSWVRPLQKKIESLSKKSTYMLNLSRLNTNSALLSQQLTEVLSWRSPDFVISLLGLDDHIAYTYKAFPHKMKRDWRLRSLLLAQKTAKHLSLSRSRTSSLTAEQKHLFAQYSSIDYKNFLFQAKKWLKESPQNKAFYTNFLNQIEPQKKFRNLAELVEILRSLSEREKVFPQAAWKLAQIYYKKSLFHECVWALSQFVKGQGLHTSQHYDLAMRCLTQVYKIGRRDKITSKAVERVHQQLMPDFEYKSRRVKSAATQYHLKQVYQLSQSKNFKLVLVQYPMASLNWLKALFSPKFDYYYNSHYSWLLRQSSAPITLEGLPPNIIWVDNQTNFMQTTDGRGYFQMFKDRYYQKFGTPQQVAYEKMAQNVFQAISPWLRSIE